MKHGDKAKAKSAKASSKAPDPKSSSKAAGKESSAAKAGKTGAESKGKQAGAKAPAEKSGKAGPGNGKTGRGRDDEGGFSNPLVGAAFKRAVKKYPNAFRRLTD